MTSTTNNVASLSYAQRVAQIICNGLYPEADGKSLAEFPQSTRANLLTIAEAILLEAPMPAHAEGVASESTVSLHQALVTVGKLVAGDLPGCEGWLPSDQAIFELAMRVGGEELA